MDCVDNKKTLFIIAYKPVPNETTIIASITFDCDSKKENLIIYRLGVQSNGTNANNSPLDAFCNTWRRHGVSTLLIIAAIKYCTVNNKNGSVIYLQTHLKTRDTVSFYIERGFTIINNNIKNNPEDL